MPTNDFPMVDVQSVRPLEGCRLWVRFTDGSEGVHDLSDVIAKGGVMVEPLKSQDYFERVFLDSLLFLPPDLRCFFLTTHAYESFLL